MGDIITATVGPNSSNVIIGKNIPNDKPERKVQLGDYKWYIGDVNPSYGGAWFKRDGYFVNVVRIIETSEYEVEVIQGTVDLDNFNQVCANYCDIDASNKEWMWQAYCIMSYYGLDDPEVLGTIDEDMLAFYTDMDTFEFCLHKGWLSQFYYPEKETI